jgi:chromosome segregation ATPase
MAITKEQVFETADSLCTSGTEPTYLQVRMHLGSGSFSTIQKYLRQWRDSRGENLHASGDGEIPEPLLTTARGFARDAWRVAQSLNARQSAAMREELERQQQSTVQDLEAAARMVDALQVTLEETERRRLDDSAELKRVQEKCAAIDRACVAAETARDQLAEEQSRTNNLLTTLQQQLDDRNQKIAVLTATLDQSTNAHSESVARLDENLQKKELELIAQRSRSEELSRSVTTMEVERDGLLRELSLLKEQLVCEQDRNKSLLATVQQLSACFVNQRVDKFESTNIESTIAAPAAELTMAATDPVLRVVGDYSER